MTRIKIKSPNEETSRETCKHYWIIESANGPTSQGTCKYCGERKVFLNTFPDLGQLKWSRNPVGSADADVEDEEEEEEEQQEEEERKVESGSRAGD